MAAFEEMQRLSASPEMAARIRQASYATDVSEPARQVTVPSLVMHLRDDAVAPFEEGRRLAALIPGARFVPLSGRSHIMGAADPAWREFVEGTLRFVGEDQAPVRPSARMTARELAVMRLVIAGLGNEQIAARLQLSVRTVERHLSNVYAKLGVSGKAARAAAAARFTGHG